MNDRMAWDDGDIEIESDDSIEKESRNGLMVFKDAKGQDRWVTFSSNAYEDRDRETVTTKALERATARMQRTKEYGPLRLWHIKGLDIGDCDYSTTISRTLVESGTFRKPLYAKAMAQAAPNLQTSIGFLPSPGEPDEKGLYHDILIRERSVTPKDKAANYFTMFMVQ